MQLRSIFVLAFATAPVFAQGKPTPSAVADARELWKEASGFVLEAAVDMPEAKYAYKPTPSVRSFGELIGHVAGSQTMFCAIGMGEKPPAEDAVEKTAKTKAALVEALRASNTYCAKAYAQSDAAATASVDLFGAQRTRLFTLMENASHDNEHYGNIVTYMRMNGMVPPSSKPA
ncbi:MAG: DinB family protein, partial [Gemmatimonadales bacterium]